MLRDEKDPADAPLSANIIRSRVYAKLTVDGKEHLFPDIKAFLEAIGRDVEAKRAENAATKAFEAGVKATGSAMGALESQFRAAHKAGAITDDQLEAMLSTIAPADAAETSPEDA